MFWDVLLRVCVRSAQRFKGMCQFFIFIVQRNIMIIQPVQFGPKLRFSVFHRDANEICVLLGVYVANSSNFVPTLRDNLSTPFSRIKQSKETD